MRRAHLWTALAPLAAGALLAGGCGGKGGSHTFTIDVDGTSKSANESYLAYFPNVVHVHAGDTVVFRQAGNGEPHTVTFGAVVDKAVDAFAKAGQQGGGPAAVAAQQADAQVPQLLPAAGDAVQVASNPCFVTTPNPVFRTLACPKVSQPELTGAQSYYNSGWLGSNEKFAVQVSKATRPGTYSFMCLLHREPMSGKIVVVPAATSVPSPAEVKALGEHQRSQLEQRLQTAVTDLRRGRLPLPGVKPYGTHVVFAGSGSPSVQDAAIDEFGPETIHVPVGGSVIWYFLGPHSITFNSGKSNDDVRSVASDGSVHLNFRAFAPTSSGEPPGSTPAGGAPAKTITFGYVPASPWLGTGFESSGVYVRSRPPTIEGWQLTFTKAGTYKYICTVHDDMKGTVVVG